MKKTFGIDFTDDVGINKEQLDIECELQPSLYYYYAEQLAEARRELEEAKDKCKEKEASISLMFRRNPDMLNVKATEAVFASCIDTHSEVLEAREDVRKKQYAVDLMYAQMNALDNRKSMLDNLVRLQISSYYSSNTGDVQSARDRLNR